MKSLLSSMLLLFIVSLGIGQNYTLHTVQLIENQKEELVIDWTSFVVEQVTEEWKECYVILKNDTILLMEDRHESQKHSQQFFSSEKESIILFSPHSIQLKVHVFNVEPIKNIPQLRVQGNCSQPTIILGSDWRNNPTSLKSPTAKPVQTPVKHIIVHHSAGSNTYTNYYDMVRNIYVYHTESNGWDDIGYNYLIAANGLIFEGRAPQGVADTDNIRGAHLCNKNDSTMAICLLGDFTNVSPSAEMLEALYQLTAWKLMKENIDPFGKSIHSIGPNVAKLPSALLPHIAGHRDGCQKGYTECPGEQVYQLLPTIRQKVADKIEALCVQSVHAIETHQKYEYANHQITFFEEKECIFVYDVMGNLQITNYHSFFTDISNLKQGIYFIKSLKEEKIELIRIIKI